MTTYTAPTLSKTRVRKLTRDIRRDADSVKNLMDAVDNTRTGGETLEQALKRRPQVATKIYDLLGDIDGTSAMLREVLDV